MDSGVTGELSDRLEPLLVLYAFHAEMSNYAVE